MNCTILNMSWQQFENTPCRSRPLPVTDSCQQPGAGNLMSKQNHSSTETAESYHAIDIWKGAGWRFAVLVLLLAFLSALILIGSSLSIG